MNEVAQFFHQVATAMERTHQLLRAQLNTPALFVSPTGMLYWGSAFQQFKYMLTEVCAARRIEFYMCAPNLRVGQDDLRPSALSVHAYLAAISRLLQTLERSGNAQLTWDDAINYYQGMRLTSDQEGTRLLPDATLAERENMRRYNWLVREAHPITEKADLAAVWDQTGRWPANCEVKRTIPQDLFAENTEIIKLPLGLRHIVAHEAVVLERAIQARETTYCEWYHDRFATVTLTLAAQELSVSFPALMTRFDPGWSLDVVNDEFNIIQTRVKKLTEILELMTVSEELALALALGPTLEAAGDFGDLLELYTYLVLVQGKVSSLIGLGEVLFMQNKQNYTERCSS